MSRKTSVARIPAQAAQTESARYAKLGDTGEELPADATEWVAVLDRSTDLIWTRNDLPCGRVDWKSANKAAAALKLCGLKGWRLPSRAELFSLVDDTRHSPAIDVAFFPDCKSSWYWAGTPAAWSPGGYAWCVDFGFGGASYDYQGGGGFVRAVRPRQ